MTIPLAELRRKSRDIFGKILADRTFDSYYAKLRTNSMYAKVEIESKLAKGQAPYVKSKPIESSYAQNLRPSSVKQTVEDLIYGAPNDARKTTVTLAFYNEEDD